MTSLTDLHREISACSACPLARGRTHAVPGEGPPDAKIVFIGEAPGFNEDKQARPFVGQAGKFLDELIQLAGFRREEVYITNVVKCRPPNNRDPLPVEMDTCQELWLDKQVETIKPQVIVTLGRYSFARFFPQETMSKVRGRILEKNGILFVPIYHPAAALHQQRFRSIIVEDFRKLPEVLAQAQARAQEPAAAPKEPEAPQPKQLGLF